MKNRGNKNCTSVQGELPKSEFLSSQRCKEPAALMEERECWTYKASTARIELRLQHGIQVNVSWERTVSPSWCRFHCELRKQRIAKVHTGERVMGLVWQLIARADELPLWQEAVLWEAKAAFLKIEVRRIPESKVRAFLIWVLGAYI